MKAQKAHIKLQRTEGQEAHISCNALKVKQPTAARPKGQEDPAARPERAEALSPGHRPGYNVNQRCAL